MPTYRQEWSYYEDGYGDTNILFVLSDTYDGLFVTTGTVVTDVFSIGSIKQDLNLSNGALAADEIQIRVDESAISSADDLAAVQFYLAAQDRANKRYVGVFVNTAALPGAPVIGDAIYVGVVDSKMKANDSLHYGGMYSDAINAVREWDSSGATFLDNAIADISLEHLIYGNETEDITGIDEAWITANVADRLGYHKSVAGDPFGDRSAKFEKLVNLNALLRKLADNLEQTLVDKGLGIFSIVFETMTLDASFSPARFVTRMGALSRKSRMLNLYGVVPDAAKQPFVVKPGDLKVLSLGDGVSDDNSPWVHWRMVMPVGRTERSMSYLRCKNFSEFLYSIAASFNLFVRFQSMPGNELRVRFISRRDIEQDEVFFRDADSGSVDLTSEAGSDVKPILGVTTLYTPDGSELSPQSWPETYTFNTVYYEDLIPTRQHGWVSSSNGEKALITTGVPLKTYAIIEDAKLRDEMRLSAIPHNTVFYLGDDRELDLTPDRQDKAALGITSMMYVKTTVIDEAVSPSSLPIWLPIAAVHAKIEGVDYTYYSLTAYANAIGQRDSAYYAVTYELTIPYINCFSLSDTGSDPSWKNLKLGSKLTIEEDGQPLVFVCVAIERDLSALTTRVKLHRLSRFAFSTPAGPSGVIVPSSDLSEGDAALSPIGAQPSYSTIADETVTAGDALRAYYNGSEWRVKRMRSQQSDYNSMVGIALNDAATDEVVRVQTTGRVQMAAYDFVPGMPVYVRASTPPTPNVSQSLLTAIDGTEDMVVDIGTADSTTSFVLNLFEQFILEA